jgi:hypothetical protein
MLLFSEVQGQVQQWDASPTPRPLPPLHNGMLKTYENFIRAVARIVRLQIERYLYGEALSVLQNLVCFVWSLCIPFHTVFYVKQLKQ